MAGATDLAPPPAVEPEEVALAVDLKGDAAPQQVMLRAFNQLIRQIVRKRLVPAGLATVEVGPAALVRTSLARHRTAQPILTPAQVAGYDQQIQMLAEAGADRIAVLARVVVAPRRSGEGEPEWL